MPGRVIKQANRTYIFSPFSFMEIQKQTNGDLLEMKIQGRLDAYWSDHLTNSIEESIRQGSHKIQLNLSQVDYLSSAGIRVLLKFYKQLKGINGFLSVAQPSEGARSILAMAGLADVLITDETPEVPEVKAQGPVRHESENGIYYVHEIAPGATLKCSLVGDPGQLETGFSECHNLSFPESTFGIGVGAFGTDFNDCAERFGEFFALEGAAAYLPTDGANVPDYVLSEGALVPEIKALYALAGKGRFARLIRFDAKPEPPGVIAMGDLAEAALQFSKADSVAIAMIAEAGGLVGAALRKSPAKIAKGEAPLAFPGVRDWLSFTAERAYERTLCLVVGIASRSEPPAFKPILRPIGPGTTATGHFHAAVFPYRPLQRGELNLRTAVNGLFITDPIQTILHLLPDDRDFNGVGQSEFMRGAIWVGPISDLAPGS